MPGAPQQSWGALAVKQKHSAGCRLRARGRQWRGQVAGETQGSQRASGPRKLQRASSELRPGFVAARRGLLKSKLSGKRKRVARRAGGSQP